MMTMVAELAERSSRTFVIEVDVQLVPHRDERASRAGWMVGLVGGWSGTDWAGWAVLVGNYVDIKRGRLTAQCHCAVL